MIPLKEFITAIKDARDALLDIPKKLDSLRNSVDNQTSAVNQAAEAAKKQSQAPPVIRAEFKVPVADKATENTETVEQKWRERIKTFLEFLTLAAVVWYACEAHKQSKSVEKSANAAETAAETAQAQLITDERPWVYVSSFRLSGEPEPGKPFWITTFIVNSGRTAAIESYTVSRVFSLRGQPVNPNFEEFQTKKRGLILPNASSGSAIIASDSEHEVMNAPQVEAYNSGDHKLFIVLKIYYSDSLNHSWWTTVCAFHPRGAPLNDFTFCDLGNAVGETKEN